jgi:hypothetical protein
MPFIMEMFKHHKKWRVQYNKRPIFPPKTISTFSLFSSPFLPIFFPPFSGLFLMVLALELRALCLLGRCSSPQPSCPGFLKVNLSNHIILSINSSVCISNRQRLKKHNYNVIVTLDKMSNKCLISANLCLVFLDFL